MRNTSSPRNGCTDRRLAFREKSILPRLLISTALALAGCANVHTGSPPIGLSAPDFYAKHIDARGIPVLSSRKVSDEALINARAIVLGMLAYRPELGEWLAAKDYRIAIIAEDEALLDLPEQADWKKPKRSDPRLTRCERKHYDTRIGELTDRAYYDARARAISGHRMVAAEEDILGRSTSRWYGETIIVHEFAHNVLFAIEAVDPELYADVEAAYANALDQGLWLDEYTTTTVHEYWAEGTQFWFESNRLQAFDGTRILSPDDLKAYDPALYRVLARAYGDVRQLPADPFYRHPARVPPGPLPENTAEVC